MAFIFLFGTYSGHLFAKDSVQSWPEMSIFHMDSEWKDHNGRTLRLKDLQGQLRLVAMVYTSCEHTCPMIISKMQSIQNKLQAKQKVKLKLTLISFDPERDTPENLKKYSVSRKLDDQWLLMTGKPSGIRSLAAVLGVNFKKETNGDFSHSNILSLVNAKGVVINQMTSLNEKSDEMVRLIMQLTKK